MIFLRLFPSLILLLFILLQRANIRLKTYNGVTITINLPIIAIELTEQKIQKMQALNLPKLFKSIHSILKPMSFLLSKCDTVINYKQRESCTISLADIGIIAVNNFILSALATHSKSFKAIDSSGANKICFDATFYFSLYHLIISALLFIYYMVKNKVKRVIKNV